MSSSNSTSATSNSSDVTNPLVDGLPRAQLLVQTEFVRSRLVQLRKDIPLEYSEEELTLDMSRIDSAVGFMFYEVFGLPLEDVKEQLRITHTLSELSMFAEMEPFALRLYFLDFMCAVMITEMGL